MLLTTVPFAGFYNSVHDSEIDHSLEMLFQNDNGDTNEALSARFWELIDWTHVQTQYAKTYVENFAEYFEVKLKWESMTSPKFYNFETDRLFAHISLAEVRRTFKRVTTGAMDAACKERFTSRSGFISGYSNDYKAWGGMQGWDHNQVGTMLQALAEQETTRRDGFDSWAELRLMEDVNSNGDLDNWLYEAAKDCDEKKQIDRVYSYLRNREERRWRVLRPPHGVPQSPTP